MFLVRMNELQSVHSLSHVWHSCHYFCVLSVVDKDLLSSSCDYKHLLVVNGRDLAPLNELHDFCTDNSWLVLLNDVTTVSNDVHFILALHVRHRQLSVHSLSSR